MESLIIAYDKNMHWIYPDLNSVLSKKFHFLWNGPVAGNTIFDCYEVTKTIAKEFIDIITLHSKENASPLNT